MEGGPGQELGGGVVVALEPEPVFDHAVLHEGHLFGVVEEAAAADGQVVGREVVVAQGHVVHLLDFALLQQLVQSMQVGFEMRQDLQFCQI